MANGQQLKNMKELIFSGNICRDCSYYVYVNDGITPRLTGPFRFTDNDTVQCEDGVYAGFGVTANGLSRLDGSFFDFWDGKTYSELPNPRIQGTGSNKVCSYNGMHCFVDGAEYINMNGTWKQYAFESGGE